MNKDSNNNIDENWLPIEEIKTVLNRKIIRPFIESMSHDPVVSLKHSNALVLLQISERLIIENYKEAVRTGGEKQKIKETNLYLGYLGKVFESAIILIGTADYLSAIILLRSVFELLIGIATDTKGGMKEKIFSIDFFEDTEKKSIHKFWKKLCAWAHPYEKWFKNICPKFYGTGKNYHPNLFTQCLDYSDFILDLILTITVERFKLDPQNYIDSYKEKFENGDFLIISNLEMFKTRLINYS